MAHLHLPDGLLPPWLWAIGYVLAWIALAALGRSISPQRIAYQGALGALALVAMAIPFGPLEIHLTLAGPVGVLLGPVAGFQVGFVVSAILALIGHGGLTTIGLNALLFGAAAALAYAVYLVLAPRLGTPWAMASATGAGQVLAGALWFAVAALALRFAPDRSADPLPHHAGWFLMIGLPLWLVGTAVEATVAFGIGRFLARVHPALLPRTSRPLAEAT
jgi:cobalt/nickel transport system permease protein